MTKHSGFTVYLTTGLALFTSLALLLLAMPAAAQQCESMLEDQRFTLIVPYGPGGGYDGYARVFVAQFEALTNSTMRIRYLPGAGTMIGISAVIEAGPEDRVLGFFNPAVLLDDVILGRDSPAMSSLLFLASLYTDKTVWVTRKDKPVVFEHPEPRLFALASNTDFSRIQLPGFALGWDINLITGYNGSNEGLFALLRGDVDYYYLGSISLANQLQSMEGLTPFLSLTDGPNSVFPATAYLAGAGGVVEQLTRELDVEQQRERQEIARLTVELSQTYRAISISRNADPELVDCLTTAVEATAFSAGLRDAAAAQNLVIEAKDGAAVQARIDQIEALIENNWDLLQQLVARSR